MTVVNKKNSRLMPSNDSDTTIVPITVPLANAMRRPSFRLLLAACVVRTFARTAMYMPKYPAVPLATAPQMNANAVQGLMPESGSWLTSSSSTITITHRIATERYSRRRNAPAPRWIALAIFCIRSLPASCARIQPRR